ncbi:MAG: hypothetical protein ACRBCS_11485 [Cellvibrionaceae bacterium]
MPRSITSLLLIPFLWVLPISVLADPITVDATANAITINGLESHHLKKISLLTDYERRSIISVYISDDYLPESTIALSILGETIISKAGIQFIPAIPFKTGQQYLLVFSLLPIEEILVHEEFFTLKKTRDKNTGVTPIDNIFNLIKLTQEKSTSRESLSIRPLLNAITISGLSTSQLNKIAQLDRSKRNQLIALYDIGEVDIDNNSTNLMNKDHLKVTLPGTILLTDNALKFIPAEFLNIKKRYLLIFSLEAIDQILFHEEILTLLTIEESLEKNE